jgi:hypothetical protein
VEAEPWGVVTVALEMGDGPYEFGLLDSVNVPVVFDELAAVATLTLPETVKGIAGPVPHPVKNVPDIVQLSTPPVPGAS